MERKGLVRPGLLDDQRFYFWKISVQTEQVPSMFC